jgi:flagellar basal-body rod modification protein FlgD
MSGTITSTNTNTNTNAAASAASSADALTSISSNFNEFLTLLTTQLQNQDPSSPMDTSTFTSELAQFAGVEQQVNTNTNLTSLIQLSQTQDLLQGSSLLGDQVSLNSTTLPLQNSVAGLHFTSPVAQPVQITVQTASGTTVQQQTVYATAGTNLWQWNGQGSAGGLEPDGAYTVAVSSAPAGGKGAALSFTTLGTVTGVTNGSGGVTLALGASSLPLSAVAQIDGAAKAASG